MSELEVGGMLGDGRLYRTAQAAVADRLRRAVLSGMLAPGSRLLQADVAAEMKTSTTPVREAMRELAGEGLLDLDPHRGVVVHQGGDAELRELYNVRMLLEPVAIAATVANITPAQLDRAQRILDQMERETDFAEWAILNQTFHGLLAEASRLEIITSILKKLRNLSSLYVASSIHRSPDRISTGNAEHRALLDACRAGDAARAQELELTHLRHTVEMGGERLPVPAEFTEALPSTPQP
jgi:DNA-binding GntR family transcriptional regulator